MRASYRTLRSTRGVQAQDRFERGRGILPRMRPPHAVLLCSVVVGCASSATDAQSPPTRLQTPVVIHGTTTPALPERPLAAPRVVAVDPSCRGAKVDRKSVV